MGKVLLEEITVPFRTWRVVDKQRWTQLQIAASNAVRWFGAVFHYNTGF